MARTLKAKIKTLAPERQKKIHARAAQLIAEEQTLRDLREALELTQVNLAERLGVGQESISRLEKRTDLLISTLRSCVEAMGGNLQLVATFPDRPPVALSGFAAMENHRRKNGREEIRP